MSGAGGAIGGGIGLLVDIGTLGLSGGAGTLIGVVAGGALGAALGNRIEAPGLLEKGDAFEFLYAAHSKNPKVANAQLVEQALEQIPSYDKNSDGRRWYTRDDLKIFLRKRPQSPSIAE